MRKNEEWIAEELAALEAKGLGRSDRTGPQGSGLLNFASNDYLDLAAHQTVKKAAADALARYGAGATASRLVCGTLELHHELERRLAAHKGYESALVFGTGYMANAGVIPRLAGRGDLILADRLVHASIIDAARLSGARLLRFRHNDPQHLEELLRRQAEGPGRCLIVTESVFSMDGDIAPLEEIAGIGERFGALLMADEAHSTGIFGPGGAGLVPALGLQDRVNICMGTLSKAFGGYGGYVACSPQMRSWLVHGSRAFIYTTAPPPAQIGAALGALDVLSTEPQRGTQLLENAAFFRALLRDAGLDTLDSASQIVPVLIGENEKTLQVSAALLEKGIRVPAIRPPTVPAGTARLRFSVTLAHTRADLERTARIVREVVASDGGAA